MHDQVGALFQRLHQIGRGEGGIHQERQAVFVGDFRNCRHIEHVEARIARVSPKIRRVLGRIAARMPARSRGETKLVVMPKRAVCIREDYASRRRARAMRQCGCLHPSAWLWPDAMPPGRWLWQSRRRRFECADALFEHGIGRVGNARIDMTGALHIEQGRGLVAVLEDEGGGQIDRRGASAILRIGDLAGMQAQGVETVTLSARTYLGRYVGLDHALEQGDAVLQQQLAFLQPAQQQLILGRCGKKAFDRFVEVAMLQAQFGEPARQCLWIFCGEHVANVMRGAPEIQLPTIELSPWLPASYNGAFF